MEVTPQARMPHEVFYVLYCTYPLTAQCSTLLGESHKGFSLAL